MKSYIKIYGPPIAKAIEALETMAIDMPEVCIMDTMIQLEQNITPLYEEESVQDFFTVRHIGPVPTARCGNIISKSEESIGEYDFYFEWIDPKGPSPATLHTLINKIDAALASLGCRYTITTK